MDLIDILNDSSTPADAAVLDLRQMEIPDFTSKMRELQHTGLAHIVLSEATALPALIVSDGMSSGKTITALVTCRATFDFKLEVPPMEPGIVVARGALIAMPGYLIPQWEASAVKFFGGMFRLRVFKRGVLSDAE